MVVNPDHDAITNTLAWNGMQPSVNEARIPSLSLSLGSQGLEAVSNVWPNGFSNVTKHPVGEFHSRVVHPFRKPKSAYDLEDMMGPSFEGELLRMRDVAVHEIR